jgi:hypothetical protein
VAEIFGNRVEEAVLAVRRDRDVRTVRWSRVPRTDSAPQREGARVGAVATIATDGAIGGAPASGKAPSRDGAETYRIVLSAVQDEAEGPPRILLRLSEDETTAEGESVR